MMFRQLLLGPLQTDGLLDNVVHVKARCRYKGHGTEDMFSDTSSLTVRHDHL